MRFPVTLGLVLAAALTSTATAHADATRLVDGRLIDATSDGRYVLYDDGSGPRLLDRTAGTTLPLPTGAEQLADRSPRVLIKGADGYRVLDTATGTLLLATLDESTDAVPATAPQLVRDGRSVIFQTGTGAAARILERRLDTATTVVRGTGVTLLHASEDAHVVTWSRPLPPAFRPAGQVPLAADPPQGVPGVAVGYTVDAQAPRVLRTTNWSQAPVANFLGLCTRRTYAESTLEPLDLTVVQDGDAGKYAFAITYRSVGYPGSSAETIVTSLVNAAGEQQALGAPVVVETADFAFDPVSSAHSFVVRFREADGSLSRGHGYLFGDDASRTELGLNLDQYGGATGPTDVDTVVPVLRGAGAIADASENGTPRAVYAFPGATSPVAPSPNGWLTLPRSADPLDGSSIRPAAQYAVCLPPGPFSSYVQVAPATNAQRTRVVRFTPDPSPAEYAQASLLTAKVTWLGVPVWQRTFRNNPGTFTTPALPAGWTGFRLSLALQLDSTPGISGSLSIDR